MKPQFVIQRPAREQDVLKLFAAGSGPGVPGELLYLAYPVYHCAAGGGWRTVAGDGRAFLWTDGRVPGFNDYLVPNGDGYFSLPSLWRDRWREGDTPAPLPAGAWASGQCDEVFLLQQPARVRRDILARLQALDTCLLTGAEEWRLASGQVAGWRSLWLSGTFGKRRLAGKVFCEVPAAVRYERKLQRQRSQRGAGL